MPEKCNKFVGHGDQLTRCKHTIENGLVQWYFIFITCNKFCVYLTIAILLVDNVRYYLFLIINETTFYRKVHSCYHHFTAK